MLEETTITGLYKDKETGALIRDDSSKLTAYKKQKQLYRDIANMKNDIRQLKEAVQKICNALDTRETNREQLSQRAK